MELAAALAVFGVGFGLGYWKLRSNRTISTWPIVGLGVRAGLMGLPRFNGDGVSGLCGARAERSSTRIRCGTPFKDDATSCSSCGVGLAPDVLDLYEYRLVRG